jgi:hypothetical protein
MLNAVDEAVIEKPLDSPPRQRRKGVRKTLRCDHLNGIDMQSVAFDGLQCWIDVRSNALNEPTSHGWPGYTIDIPVSPKH